jgi:acyl-coenzyme A synthetase/AMP-(fatty) acid ligase/acyl carrier protein
VNHIRADDKLTLFHSIAFGSSHINLYQSLLNGASLHPFDIKSEGITRILPWLREEQITIFHSTPLVFRQLAESLSNHIHLSALRLINLSGAPVSKLEIDLYRKHFPATTVFEISIGATETHTFASFIVDQNFSLPDNGVPVGYPRPGREVVILDATGNTVEPGQTGEIAVRSRYLNLPFPRQSSTTRDSKSASAQVYLTGDLGRMMSDGFLIHVGRKDFVTKIRGFRVSVVEIETALMEHSGVMEAAVVPWDSIEGEKQLVAYVVPRKQSILTVRAIANFLRTKLPIYAIPSTFVFLDSIPQTNGKLDRRSLPRPERVRSNLGNAYVSATNATEQQLIAVWEDVLDIRPIGIHDRFFDLGGHSLAASRVVARVIQTFNVELPVKSLFDAPTVAEMATVITQNLAKLASDAELEQMLREVEAMTEEEAQKQLAGGSPRSSSEK